jgi:hypothetical protein
MPSPFGKSLTAGSSALSHQGNLVYCQATTGDSSHSPDAALAREIRFR